MLAVFRRRDFLLLWFAGLISVAGDWVLMTALPYFVYVKTGSTLATAGMTAAELTPAIVLTSPAGVLVDRWNRKRILVVTNLLQGCVVSAFLLVGEALSIVYVVAALQSAVASFSGPAESALLPTLVPKDLLGQANAMNALNNRLGRLAGVPLGAALLSLWGLESVVIVDALTFLAAAFLVAPIVLPRTTGPRHADEKARRRGVEESPLDEVETALTRFWVEWVDGLRIVRADRTIALLFVVFGLMTFGGTMLDPLFVPWIRDVLHRGVDVVALLTMASSLSGVAGSLAVGAVASRLSARSLMGWGSLLAGATLLVKFNVPVLSLVVGLSMLGGFVSVASSVGVETLAQQRTPEEVRGRVFGSLQASIWLMSLLGAVAGGVIGQVLGVLPGLNLSSTLVALSGVVVLFLVPRSARTARTPPKPDGRHVS